MRNQAWTAGPLINIKTQSLDTFAGSIKFPSGKCCVHVGQDIEALSLVLLGPLRPVVAIITVVIEQFHPRLDVLLGKDPYAVVAVYQQDPEPRGGEEEGS